MRSLVSLCLSSGTCSGTPAQIIAKLRADAAAVDASNGYGFLEDPNSSPITGRYYGYLASAAGYSAGDTVAIALCALRSTQMLSRAVSTAIERADPSIRAK